MTNILTVENLHFSYGQIKAIRGINLHLKHGELVAVVGPNGAGKSTLLKTIFQVVKKTQGKIYFLDKEINSTTHKLADYGLALVPEGRGTIRNLTVYENLLIAYEAKSKKNVFGRKLHDALAEVYSLFPRLEERLGQIAGSLSGGEQQMLAIAKALMVRPKLMMLDEPSLGLSPVLVKEVFKIIQHLREEGVTILLVEQNARSALLIADRGYVLSNGRVVMEGKGKELLLNNQMLSAYLGG